MLRSLIKFNVIHIWPHKIICYQGHWPSVLETKAEILLPPGESHAVQLNKLSEYVSQLSPWHPTSIILFGNKLIYRLVGHQAQLSPSEFVILVEHQLQKVLGRKANDYLNFIQRIHYEKNNLGIAVDAQWLQAIQSIITRANLYFINIQPAAVWLFNKLRKHFVPNSWNIVEVENELYFIKLKDRQIDYFKVAPIKNISNPTEALRKEILMFGDDPEHVEIHIHNLADITKKKTNSSFVADQST